jgi:hypothetical protein
MEQSHPFRIRLNVFNHNVEIFRIHFSVFFARKYAFSGGKISKKLYYLLNFKTK